MSSPAVPFFSYQVATNGVAAWYGEPARQATESSAFAGVMRRCSLATLCGRGELHPT
jgi:hypothetical protein